MKKKQRSYKGQKLPYNKLRGAVYHFLKRNAGSAFGPRQIIKKLKLGNDKSNLSKVLKALQKERKIEISGAGRYMAAGTKRSKDLKTVHQGTVDLTRSGDAYVVCETLADDVFVSAKNLRNALDGDLVEIEVSYSRHNRSRGVVTRILQPANEFFVGIYHQFRNYGIVVPDNIKIPFDIFIKPARSADASDGDKVVAKILEWAGKINQTPMGEVTMVLGAAGTHDIEMQSILLQQGFNLGFPDAVMQETNALGHTITQEEIAKRRDFRETVTFTIDPDTAQDFDDALSINYLDDGGIEVGVHIADVTHFVRPGTALDKEAFARSTSVYLVDRVLPMLPEKLSNALCSLRPNEDSLCFSAVFTFDKDAKVRKRWFGKTIIHSDHRFTYEEAQAALESGEGEYGRHLRELNRIAYRLREKKLGHGALIFETDEVKFKLDAQGVPVQIFVKERKDAHLLIEDFMLLANREVARFMAKKGQDKEIPFVYRVHDLPDPDKLAELALFARELGFKMQIDKLSQVSSELNRLARAARQNEVLKILQPIAIRCMAKAAYTTDNIGHYGLAFKHYTHFTSPIRRYSDVLVHRFLERNLSGIHRTDKKELEQQCRHISNQEKRAAQAERQSVKFKLAEYMQQHIGDTFEGYVSGMIDRGFFVELRDTMAEGMVTWDSLAEPYDLSDNRLAAEGRRTGNRIKMGDRMLVRVVHADPIARQIEMELVEEE